MTPPKLSPLRFLVNLILPVLIAGVLPLWLIHGRLSAYDTRWPDDFAPAWAARLLGAAVLLGGLALFIWCVALFARRGRGTIMPWDPTQQLIITGPYRHIRNPMITAVLCVVAGQALFHGSALTAALALFFFLVNHVYFIKSEEPGLEKRFGQSYRDYKATVPRWLPRVKQF